MLITSCQKNISKKFQKVLAKLIKMVYDMTIRILPGASPQHMRSWLNPFLKNLQAIIIYLIVAFFKN